MCFELILGCSCMNYVGKKGFGNCKKYYDGILVCYVDNQSTCPDKMSSRYEPGMMYSQVACRIKLEGTNAL